MDPGYLIARRATHYNPGGLKLAKMRGPTKPGAHQMWTTSNQACGAWKTTRIRNS